MMDGFEIKRFYAFDSDKSNGQILYKLQLFCEFLHTDCWRQRDFYTKPKNIVFILELPPPLQLIQVLKHLNRLGIEINGSR